MPNIGSGTHYLRQTNVKVAPQLLKLFQAVEVCLLSWFVTALTVAVLLMIYKPSTYSYISLFLFSLVLLNVNLKYEVKYRLPFWFNRSVRDITCFVRELFTKTSTSVQNREASRGNFIETKKCIILSLSWHHMHGVLTYPEKQL